MIDGPSDMVRIGEVAAGAGIVGALYATFVPGSGIWCPVVTRGTAGGRPRVALTFDDGPLPGSTDRILDILAEQGVKAVFFVIGRPAEQHPDLVRRIHDEGHLVANHTYHHPTHGWARGLRFWRRQIERTDAVVERAIGLRPRFFRPPMGIKSFVTARAARGHAVIGWTRRGFDGVATTPQRVVARLAPRARAGEILLLHDGISPQSRRDPTVTIEALRPLIQELRARGLDPVRLDELTGLQPYRELKAPPAVE